MIMKSMYEFNSLHSYHLLECNNRKGKIRVINETPAGFYSIDDAAIVKHEMRILPFQ